MVQNKMEEVAKLLGLGLEEELILNEKEKEYLSLVIKPFRDRVINIKKESGYSIECIKITLNPLKVMTADDISYLPNFIKGSMYKGMETDKAYTIDELGL